MAELQRCPNCGGHAKLHRRHDKFYYECDGDCWTQTDKYWMVSDAETEWNNLKPREREQEDE